MLLILNSSNNSFFALSDKLFLNKKFNNLWFNLSLNYPKMFNFFDQEKMLKFNKTILIVSK